MKERIMSRRKNKLIGFISCLLLLLVLVPPSYGIKVSACTGGAGGSISTSDSYELDTSASLNVDAILDQGAIYQERRVSGSGKNCLKEAVYGNQYSIENSIASTGQISGSSKTAASNDAGIVGTSTSISGERGFIESATSSKRNTVLVAGGFSEEGYLQSDLVSSAAERASTDGTATMLGVECYNPDVTQFLASGDSAVSMQGLHLTSNGGLGDFEMQAVNSEHSGMNARRTVTRTRPTRDSESNGYLFTGWRLANDAGIQMQLSESTVPSNISSQDAATAICTAANTWDAQTHENLFSGDDSNNAPGNNAAVTMTTYTPSYSNSLNRDYRNTEAWTTGFGESSNVIAMTMTWYEGNIRAANRMRYSPVTESDCWYNAYLQWRIAPGEDSSKGPFDVQTVALHELGHTLGLADLYNPSNSAKTMYGYNDGHADRTLDQTDINGLVQLYGPK